ncbi:mannose-6-phosphate isomerase type 1 [Raoultella sp. BIGb0399]|uniref:mannose-6-phosphate isomerase n=1 Tax=Raoultella lignicola TaxID=3040939 RepID=A0ABU9FGS0_9ENTR|nr:mannose-6-phosphate isomerase, class I [Raoultella sp. BIGb0399]ROS15051.1 mannose-6-phosphate isomerase type 1 [Raoultella sp. BIGb0399]
MTQVFYRLRNNIKNYAWGSRTALNTLFHVPNPDDQPQAEMWMGTHPAGCSEVECGQSARSLQTLIAEDLTAMLGERAATRFGQLPFLLKFLAADSALSIQVHPNKMQAEEGFSRQGNQPGEAYNDDNHKPELVYALTPFMAMNGFRPYQEIVNHFLRLNAPELTGALTELRSNMTADGLMPFFLSLMQLDPAQRESVLARLSACIDSGGLSHLNPFISRLQRDYPGDIGILAPLFLHCITLNPGEAMFLWAGTLHAYVSGTAVEVMACSDNVLRAGLTPKNINLAELVKCTVFTQTQAESLKMCAGNVDVTHRYPIPVEDFQFSVIDRCQQKIIPVTSAQILLVLQGSATLCHPCGETLSLSAGQSAFIPFSAQGYQLTQEGKCCLVSY